jgi:hypothetical protein
VAEINLNALDRVLAADARRQDGRFPWENSQFGHDHFAAEEDVRELYDRLKLAQPVISWADSPASLWRAVSMLRTYANKHDLIGSLVPMSVNRIEDAARRAMLGAILNTDVLTSTGAVLRGMLGWTSSGAWKYPAIEDAARMMLSQEEMGHVANAGKGFVSRSARYHEAAVYPALYGDAPSRLTRNCFCFTPYARAVWLCMPPTVFKTDADGHLHSDDGPAAEWRDGFQIFRNREEEERLALETAENQKQLTDGTEEKRPAGPTAMEMLREAMEEKRLRAAKPVEDTSNG